MLVHSVQTAIPTGQVANTQDERICTAPNTTVNYRVGLLFAGVYFLGACPWYRLVSNDLDRI